MTPEKVIEDLETEIHLIQAVEEFSEEANTTVSRFTVVEIENGRWYKINEYDGYESIEYRDIDDEWELAEDNEI